MKNRLSLVWLIACATGAAWAHGGGLNAEGCHTNRKTGDYHCHRGGGSSGNAASSGNNALAVQPPPRESGATGGATCYTGPRGGTYTITKSGRKNYSGC